MEDGPWWACTWSVFQNLRQSGNDRSVQKRKFFGARDLPLGLRPERERIASLIYPDLESVDARSGETARKT